METVIESSRVKRMTNAIVGILSGTPASVYLTGSAVLGDFHEGWSDIDILVFTSRKISDNEADELLNLREKLSSEFGDSSFKSFEGNLAALPEYLENRFTNVVYWGTSGQRIISSYEIDPFSKSVLLSDAVLLRGEDIRHFLSPPAFSALKNAVWTHLATIRKYAVNTGESMYSCGWLFDIARGIYTLRYGKVISKSAAGQWAVSENLCPDRDILLKTLEIRKNPLKYKNDPEMKKWFSSLGGAVQRFADVLEKELDKA